VIVPTRALAGFATIVNVTLPLPLPLAPPVIVIQVSDVLAVQAQPGPAVTATAVPAPAVAGADWLVGLIEYAQGAACVMVCTWPPTVIVPVRAAPVLAATLYVKVPLPLPVAPAVMLIQVSDRVAVHAHPAAVVTVTDSPVAPATPIAADVGLSDVAQDPACVTVNV